MPDDVRLISKVKINVGGLEVEVADDATCESASAVICVKASQEPHEFKSDNVHVPCSMCGVEIVHRPHAPKKPPKMCMECAIMMMNTEKGKEC